MFTSRKFWLDVLERTIKTFCQSLAGSLVGLDVVAGVDLALTQHLTAAGLAAAVALLMGVAGGQIGASSTAAWLPAGPDTDKG